MLVQRNLIRNSLYTILACAISTATFAENNQSTSKWWPKISTTIHFANTTQGPIWPPSALVDKDGNYVLIGNSLRAISPGVIAPVPNQAVLVSKDTIPPLNGLGIEDFSNPFGATYKEIRPLDLSNGSEDLNIELFANSFGPPEGDFGGGPRIPRDNESLYNLNGGSVQQRHCAELFPSESQRFTYKRDSFSLASVPIAGFQGDQVIYNVDTGAIETPRLMNGSTCPSEGCEGEDNLHVREINNVTLGDWLKARVVSRINLIDYDYKRGRHTAAEFIVQASGLLPNSVYVLVGIRQNVFEPRPIIKAPDPLSINSILITDRFGKARTQFKVNNPFPSPEIDQAGSRVLGLAVAYKSDASINGLCPIRLGPGVDIHAVASTFGNLNSTESISKLITIEAQR